MTAPVVGSSSTGRVFGWCQKSNIDVSEPVRLSNEASPMPPVRQFSPMNFRIEVWSVCLWST